MKVLRSVIGLSCLIVILFSLGTNFSSCKKEVITDTVFIKDTVHIIDSSTCSCYNLNDSLVAYYNFNNGTLNDSSGKGNHIILNNNAVKTADRFGRANNAYLFNGIDSYMKVANSSSLNPANGISIMATIKVNTFNSTNCVTNQVVGKGWNDFINGFYAMRFYSTVGCQNTVDTSKEVFYGSYGDLNTRSSDYDNNYIHSNKWYNVVYTSGDGASKIYIDGVLKSTVPSSATSFTANTQELYIGKHGDPQYAYLFSGAIDEIRIYNKVLCAAAVAQLYATKQ
ncbi:MAG: LamG domain-containing protein [Bacteroidota bacterium]